MNAQTPRRSFVAADAQEARAGGTLPLLVGLAGPSGSGKTFSALRIATGIQSVVGGDIFVIDTEQRRALHYADSFSFKHVAFGAPFGSLDYLEALRFAKKSGAGVVVIDSCSHEHDGPGGLLEQHEADLQRMAGDDYRKREQMTMLAWQKPKAGRRKLIAALTSELDLPTVFCFRSKSTTKPMKVDGKLKPVDMGFTTIGADEWMFEMALSALLLPGSNGIPTWDSDKPGERLAIKVPRQFRNLTTPPPKPLDENVGIMLARWARGEHAPAKAAPNKGERFAAEPSPPRSSPASPPAAPASDPTTEAGQDEAASIGQTPPQMTADDWAAGFIRKVQAVSTATELANLEHENRAALLKLEKQHPVLRQSIRFDTAHKLAALSAVDAEYGEQGDEA